MALNELTVALGDAASVEAVAQVILNRLVPMLGADGGTVAIPTPDGQALTIIASHGYRSEVVAEFRSIPLGAQLPLSDAARTVQPIFIESRDGLLDRYPHIERFSESLALIAVPLVVKGELLGVMGATFAEARRFSEDERSQVVLLAGQCALALQRVSALQTEIAARKRIEVLAEASKTFASEAHDLSQLLNVVARRVAQLFAESCTVTLISPDAQWLEPVALHHENPAAREEGLALFQATRQKVGVGMQGVVAASGQPMLVPEIALEAVVAATRPEYRDYVRRFAPASFVVVPLRVRGRIIGTLSVSRGAAAPRFNQDDVGMLTEVADRAALSIDNARLLSEAQASLARAQEAVHLREDFLSIAGHELKTPITSLKLELQLHERSGPTRSIGRATRQVKRLETLVQSLLDVGRLSAGRMDLQLVEVDLLPLLHEVAERFRAEAEAADTLLTIAPPSGPVIARCDRDRFDQVLTNLVSNAIKYGGGKPVLLSAQGDTDPVAILVRDNGIGIELQDQERLFERFARSQAAARHYGGMGLGLWISRQLMERMGGQLTLSSTPGEGATFRCELPRA
ncbi:MAG: GAF domain-containing protein [Myxococcota bacterium]|nr:GAF domain-containing protein [Myxococcota bacterium]